MSLPVLRGKGVTLRPLDEADLDHLAPLLDAPGIAEWWGTSDAEQKREGLLYGGNAFAVEAYGALAGWLGFEEEDEPDYRHAALDLFLSPDHQARGLGPEALRTAIRWLAEERGHHRFTIDPAAANERAVRAYERVGFRPVGTLRRYERSPGGEWRDGLLMDLLFEELRG